MLEFVSTMKQKSVQVVKEFLDRHLSVHFEQPILLGFSGGADSMALMRLFLECRTFFSLNLHLAHVDHGWRQESASQAMELSKIAQGLGLPFHLHRLEDKPQKNREEHAREQRMLFFRTLYINLGCQALVLAHHRDDQSETVLKRILEGADLHALGAMREKTSMEGMVLWRPLLKIPKKDLLAYLNRRGIGFIEDSTNRDTTFLRSRMRLELFPELSKVFGKEVGKNLSRLGESAEAVSGYLERKIAPLWNGITRQDGGCIIDFSPFLPLEALELSAFLRRLAIQEEIRLSREQLDTLCCLILAKTPNRRIPVQGADLEVSRGVLAIKTYL